MPFNAATGIYTPPPGAETAAPGQVIASAVWNAIFTDISAALTQLGQRQIVYNPRIISTSGSFTVNIGDLIVLVQAPAGTIFLPASATKLNPVTLVGNSSIFGSNNSVLVPNGVETIDGFSNITLTGNYQPITLLPLAAGGWLVTT